MSHISPKIRCKTLTPISDCAILLHLNLRNAWHPHSTCHMNKCMEIKTVTRAGKAYFLLGRHTSNTPSFSILNTPVSVAFAT